MPKPPKIPPWVLSADPGTRNILGISVALTELLARCPDFEVDESGIVWAGGSYVRRPLSVPFRVTG